MIGGGGSCQQSCRTKRARRLSPKRSSGMSEVTIACRRRSLRVLSSVQVSNSFSSEPRPRPIDDAGVHPRRWPTRLAPVTRTRYPAFKG
eukprot:1119985-Prorocentrum_minimum.AAC.3